MESHDFLFLPAFTRAPSVTHLAMFWSERCKFPGMKPQRLPRVARGCVSSLQVTPWVPRGTPEESTKGSPGGAEVPARHPGNTLGSTPSAQELPRSHPGARQSRQSVSPMPFSLAKPAFLIDVRRRFAQALEERPATPFLPCKIANLDVSV